MKNISIVVSIMVVATLGYLTISSMNEEPNVLPLESISELTKDDKLIPNSDQKTQKDSHNWLNEADVAISSTETDTDVANYSSEDDSICVNEIINEESCMINTSLDLERQIFNEST